EQGGAAGLRVEDGAGAKEETLAEGAADLAHHIERVGHGHGDFDDADAPVGQRPRDLDQLLAVRRPHYGDDPAVEDAAQVGFFAHEKTLPGARAAIVRPAASGGQCGDVELRLDGRGISLTPVGMAAYHL